MKYLPNKNSTLKAKAPRKRSPKRAMDLKILMVHRGINIMALAASLFIIWRTRIGLNKQIQVRLII